MIEINRVDHADFELIGRCVLPLHDILDPAGKIEFKVDKTGIIHTSIGKVSFDPQKIRENAAEMIQTVAKLKPASAKGTYFKSITISSTMSKGIAIDKSSIAGI